MKEEVKEERREPKKRFQKPKILHFKIAKEMSM